MNLPPFFNAQFFEDDGLPLAGGFLYTYLSGTTTPQLTYEDQAGTATNTNPIILDAAGRCNLWLAEDVEYTFLLQRADETDVKTFDDVSGVALATGVVTSLNNETGAVVLTAADIGFTTGTATDWFVGTDVEAAIDAVITRVDSAIPAGSVTITDSGALFTATNVEAALAEVMALVDGGLPTQTGNSGKFLTTSGTVPSWASPLPTQTGNAGKFLSTDGTNASWQTAPTGTSTQSPNGTVTFPGGLVMKWGTTSTLATDSGANPVTFGVAFPNNCFAVIVNASTDVGTSGGGVRYSMAATTYTVSGFNIVNDGDASAATWFAVGN